LPGFISAVSDSFREAVVDAGRDKKCLVFGPSIIAFCEPDFFITERVAMGCRRVLLVR